MALEADMPVGSYKLRPVNAGPGPGLLHDIYSITLFLVPKKAI